MGSASHRPKSAKRHFAQVLRRDDYTCQYCQFPADSVDHVIPYVLSHSNDLCNLVACCRRCNTLANSLVFDSFADKQEYLLKLRRPEIEAYAKKVLSREAFQRSFLDDNEEDYEYAS